jgi:hypothetical protein
MGQRNISHFNKQLMREENRIKENRLGKKIYKLAKRKKRREVTPRSVVSRRWCAALKIDRSRFDTIIATCSGAMPNFARDAPSGYRTISGMVKKVAFKTLTRNGLQAPDEGLHVPLASRLVQVEVGARRLHLVTSVGERLVHVVLLQRTLVDVVAGLGDRSPATRRLKDDDRAQNDQN